MPWGGYNGFLDEASRKRTADCIDRGMQMIEELRVKSKISKTITAATQRNAAPSTAVDTSDASETETNLDWKFIDEYRKDHGISMKWKRCYEAGKNEGIFKTYEKYETLKAAYYRHCRKRE